MGGRGVDGGTEVHPPKSSSGLENREHVLVHRRAVRRLVPQSCRVIAAGFASRSAWLRDWLRWTMIFHCPGCSLDPCSGCARSGGVERRLSLPAAGMLPIPHLVSARFPRASRDGADTVHDRSACRGADVRGRSRSGLKSSRGRESLVGAMKLSGGGRVYAGHFRQATGRDISSCSQPP